MYIPYDVIFSERDYLAPTVYLQANRYVSTWNYYGSLQGAIDKYYYLHNLGGSNTTPIGWKDFTNNQTAQTFAYNCDFYILKDGTWQLTTYKYLKSLTAWPPTVYRFTSVTGGGPYYGILDSYYFGLSATSIQSVPADKLAALDDFYREVQTLKLRYNTLVGFLSDLSKKPLNAIEQQIFNEGLILLNSLNQQISTVRNIEVGYAQGQQLGNPILLIIIIIVILAGATAWTVAQIVSEKEKTKRINDVYDLNKWITAKKQEVATQVQSGQISQASANSILATLDKAAATGNAVAKQAAKGGGLLSDAASILKWGAIAYLAYIFIGKNKSASAT